MDDLDWALDYDEDALSPVHNASEKPVFEDIIDFENADENGWGNGMTEPVSDKVQVSGWDTMSDHCNKISKEESGDPWGNKVERPQDKVQVSGWDKISDPCDIISNKESGDPWGNKVERPQESGWGKKVDNGQKKEDTEPKDIWEEKEDRHSEKLDLAWSTKASDQAETSGDKGLLAGWNTNSDANASNWNKRDMQSLPDGNQNSVQENKAERSQSDAWGKSDGDAGLCKKDGKDDTSNWNKDMRSLVDETLKHGSWGTKSCSTQQSDSSSPWSKKPDKADDVQWSRKDAQPNIQSQWGQKDDKVDSSSWNKDIQVDGSPKPGSWGVKSSSAQKSSSSTPWSENPVEADDSKWSQKDTQPDKQSQWGQKDDKVDSSNWNKDAQVDETPTPGSWGVKSSTSQQPDSPSPWSKKPDKADDSQWGKKDGQPDRARALGSSSGWTKKEGWSSNVGEGRPKSNRPFKPVGGTNSEFVPPPVTATGRRLDLFTADEQELLTEIEPIMQSIRKIMSQPG